MTKRLIAATANEGKLREMREILKGKYEIVSMREAGFRGEIEETGSTFSENAEIKARAVSMALGADAIADDSGLEVFALGGAPGVYSARYASHGDDAANRRKLLAEMEGVTDRRARFVTAVALCRADGSLVTAFGETRGTILTEERGKNGFGYDSVFFSDDLGKSFGEAGNAEKNAVSHRARALASLGEKLAAKTVLVLSDTHGNRAAVRALLGEIGNADLTVCLGDGAADLDEARETYGDRIASVRGNCDFLSNGKDEIVFSLNGVKFFACHGHMYGVKGGLRRIADRAEELGCGVALYGHTHRASEEKFESVLLVNPGTLSPRAERKSYAVVTVADGAARVEFRTLPR